MTKSTLKSKDIMSYLVENSNRPYWMIGIRDRVNQDDYKILKTIARLITKSQSRANDYNRQWDWNIYPDVLYSIWMEQKGLCAVTGIPLSTEKGNPQVKNPWAASIDRVDSTRGYTKDNVRLVVHWYNNAKNTWDDETCTMALTSWSSFVKKNKRIMNKNLSFKDGSD